MEAYLLTWNPEKYLDLYKNYEKWGEEDWNWTTGVNKSIPENARFFLMRLAVEPKGIVATGYTVSGHYVVDHFDGTPGKKENVNDIAFSVRGDLDHPLVPLKRLLKIRKQMFGLWTPAASGIRIPDDVASELEGIFAKAAERAGLAGSDFPDELPAGTFPEGPKKQITVNAYERNPAARRACVAHHGCRCHVCGLDFEKRYGEVGRGFIHVHHLTALATIGIRYRVNPVKDLRPVCPNCHAMLHRHEPLTLEQLKRQLRK